MHKYTTINKAVILLLLIIAISINGCKNPTNIAPKVGKEIKGSAGSIAFTDCTQKAYYSQVIKNSDSLGLMKGLIDFKQVYEKHIANQPCLPLPEISIEEPGSVTEASYILQHTQNQEDSLLALLSFSSILPYEMYPRKGFVDFAAGQKNIADVIDSAKHGSISGNCGDFAYLQQQIYNQYMPSVRSFLLQTSIRLPDSSELGHMVNIVCVVNHSDTIVYLLDPTTNTSYWDDNKLLTFQQLVGKLDKGDHEDIERKQAKRLIPQRASFPGFTSSYIAFWPVSAPAYAKKCDDNTIIFSNRDEEMWESLFYTRESYLSGLEKAGMPANWLYMYCYNNPNIKLTLHMNGDIHWTAYFLQHFPQIKLK